MDNNMKRPTRFLYSLMLVLCTLYLVLGTSGCQAPKTITHTIQKDSTIIREIPKEILVPGATITQKINIDSLAALIKSGMDPQVINNTLVKEDPETKLRMGLMLDELGNLTALCEQQDRYIQTLEKQIDHWKFEYREILKQFKKPWYQQLGDAAKWMIIGAGLLLLAAILFAILK